MGIGWQQRRPGPFDQFRRSGVLSISANPGSDLQLPSNFPAQVKSRFRSLKAGPRK
jgi:hypothetical protein